MSLVTSKYYKNTKEFDFEKNSNFVDHKTGDLDRMPNKYTICGIHFLMLKYYRSHKLNQVAKICEESLGLSHYAVAKLRDYKNDFDKGWWAPGMKEHQNVMDGWWEANKKYRSKTFTEKDEKFAKDLMNTEDDIYMYNLIRQMYALSEDQQIKHLCLEIIWMSYRINRKHYEYEQKK